MPVAHIDLYRIDHLEHEEPDLLEEYLGPDTIAFVEWPKAGVAGLGGVAAHVRISHAGGDRRVVEIA